MLEGPVEEYLSNLEHKMRATLREYLIKTRNISKSMVNNREKWLEKYPGQLCLITSQLEFTSECVKNLAHCKALNDKRPMKYLKKKQKRLLLKLSEISRKELNGQMRLKIRTLITVELHSRDVIERMLKNSKKIFF